MSLSIVTSSSSSTPPPTLGQCLLSLPPISPFVDPFQSPRTDADSRCSRACSSRSAIDAGECVDSPLSVITPTSGGSLGGGQVRKAYVAGRRSADLIKVLDLVLPVTVRMSRREGSARKDGAKGEVKLSQHSAHSSPHERSHPSSRGSKSTPLRDLHEPITNQTIGKTSQGESKGLRPSYLTESTSASGTSLAPTPAPSFFPQDFILESSPLQASPDITGPTKPPHRYLDEYMHSSAPKPRVKPKSAVDVPSDQSFLRMSTTASTVSDAPSSSVGSLRPRNRYPPGEQSFLRMSRTTTSFSDFAPASDKISSDRVLSPAGEAAVSDDIGTPGDKRSSGGTFGRPRRWTTVGSVSTRSGMGNERANPFANAREASETFLSDEEADGKTSSSGSRRRRRPASLISSSTSAYSGRLAPSVMESYNAQGHFPSPTPRHRSHRQPESDEVIIAHLLKTASMNDRRIVPSLEDRALLKRTPPSTGTPLKGGLQEETQDDSEESDEYRRKSSTKQKRHVSKVDQLLGEGAQIAGAQMKLDKRVFQDALEMQSQPPSSRPGPVPPIWGHRHTGSIPTWSASSPRLPTTPTTSLLHLESLMAPQYGQSASVDSIPSLNPSLAESVTHLLPLSHYQASHTKLPRDKSLPPLPRHTTAPMTGSTRTGPLDPEARSDLSVQDRQVLLRRKRALEKRLGEPLHGDETGQFVVMPSQCGTTVSARLNSVLPRSQPSRDLPGWGRAEDKNHKITVPALERSTSIFAQKARSALGLDKDSEDEKIRSYVGSANKEHEAESGPTTPLRPVRADDTFMQDVQSPGWSSTGTGSSWPPSPDDDDGAKRGKLRQAAKLQRLLGEVMTPSHLKAADKSESLSFIDFDDGPAPVLRHGSGDNAVSGEGWTSRLKTSVKKGKPARDESFMDLRHGRTSHDRSISSSPIPKESRHVSNASQSSQWSQGSNLDRSPNHHLATAIYPDVVNGWNSFDLPKQPGLESKAVELSESEKARARKKAQKLGDMIL